MLTALDAPETALKAQDRDYVAKIRTHGWASTKVFDDDDSPGFSYSTGFWLSLGYPEIIVFSLYEKGHTVLATLWNDIKAGNRPIIGQPARFFETNDGCLLPVAKDMYPNYLGWSRWFYGSDDFTCLQLVWPDRRGYFPWQPQFDTEFAGLQPDLTGHNWGNRG